MAAPFVFSTGLATETAFRPRNAVDGTALGKSKESKMLAGRSLLARIEE